MLLGNLLWLLGKARHLLLPTTLRNLAYERDRNVLRHARLVSPDEVEITHVSLWTGDLVKLVVCSMLHHRLVVGW